ncbi:ABC transporter permease [Brachybacterium huguangmaarense]
MTPATATASAAARPSAPDRSARPATVSQARRAVRYAVSNTAVVLRDGAFLFFTIALPAAMFLMFNTIYGSAAQGSAGVSIMTNMAAYGSFGGALSAGSVIQTERANGWLRQLTVAGLSPRAFVLGKIVTAMVILLPALVAVFAVGLTIGGVDLPLTTALTGIGVLWGAMLPMILMGLVLGLLLPPRAVQGASTLVLMVLSLVGGLWFPYDMFPAWLKTVAEVTPTYGIGRLGQWATLGADFPTQGAIVLGAWAVGLAVLAAGLFRRAARSSRR